MKVLFTPEILGLGNDGQVFGVDRGRRRLVYSISVPTCQ